MSMVHPQDEELDNECQLASMPMQGYAKGMPGAPGTRESGYHDLNLIYNTIQIHRSTATRTFRLADQG